MHKYPTLTQNPNSHTNQYHNVQQNTTMKLLRHALEVGPWSIWLSGFFLIALSLHAIQLLPSLHNHINTSEFTHNLGAPRITIFSAPDPFTAPAFARQTLAVRSWLAVSPQITVVLFSQDPSVVSFAGMYGSRVVVEPNIDFTFLGIPFFHSMVARSRAFTTDISVFINPESILLPDFISTLNFVHKLDHDWLLLASARNVSHLPFYLDEDGVYLVRDDGKQMRTHELQEVIDQNFRWNHCDDRMLIAWNSGDLPLHSGVLPPFLYRKGIHNRWIINEAILSGYRFVFDASLTITSLYLDDQAFFSNQSFRGTSLLAAEKRNWEYIGNFHLGTLYGSSFFHETNYTSLLKLSRCKTQYFFVDTATIGYSSIYRRPSSSSGRILHLSTNKETMNCLDGIGLMSGFDCSFKDQFKQLPPLPFPHSLDSLLQITADRHKTIVLGIAGYSYRDMLMSWVCRLRHLSIRNFLVCALDRETYKFSVMQGLPVFNDHSAPSNISFNDCHFGTDCFQRVTKVKSRIVLKILKLGYNVLLSDVDIYWFANPLPLLHSFGPGVLAAQSDEYNETGFYFHHPAYKLLICNSLEALESGAS
ncbi:hypothetical protein HS088_TW06G00735 [Tripterygium wilfordii]|uniref:Nucleotide-diphospho-sugar transferase domain-containing protein n=1 Tax=Tripterygium wilfordii TaxID=458696 RepID=A0A7J7DJZ9_TRIWF|nr:hypothetical protein HS088_TW06G00735 [Tripterygium wilfordii]